MTALIKDVNRTEKIGSLLAMPVDAVEIFHNALCMINAAGFIVPCSSIAGSSFAGMAYENVDNSAGVAGDLIVRLERDNAVELPIVGAVAADLGKSVFATDDNLVALTQALGDEVAVGVIVEVISATAVMVKMNTVVGK